jgi:hypothetical protein
VSLRSGNLLRIVLWEAGPTLAPHRRARQHFGRQSTVAGLRPDLVAETCGIKEKITHRGQAVCHVARPPQPVLPGPEPVQQRHCSKNAALINLHWRLARSANLAGRSPLTGQPMPWAVVKSAGWPT